MKNNFWFGVILTLSICLVCFCFVQANAIRETPAMGGEVFMIALPLLIVSKKLKMVEQEKQRLKNFNKALEEKLMLL